MTTYNPDPIGNASVLDNPDKRKQKYIGNGAPDQLPMMDRNLGAMNGYVTLPTDPIDWSKACGFHYQGGKKDPFPSSYTSKSIYSVAFNANDKTPPEGMLNQYEADGITYYSHRGVGGKVSYREAYKIPSTITGVLNGGTWNSSIKNEHDPCPAGWRVPSYTNFRALFADGTDTYWSASSTPIALYRPKGMTGDITTYLNNGAGNGYLLYYDDENHASYFRMTGYPPAYNDFRYIGMNGNIWTRESSKGFTFGYSVTNRNAPSFCVGDSWGMGDAHTVRCIQERE